ncbi:MAG: maleylpyruvate isomerase family mycothiol-dependent enzyme [Mycobacterium sp.]
MDRLAVIESESRRLADVLTNVDPDRRCPTCPEWSASDLLWHLTNVHFFWAGILEHGVQNEADLPAIEQSKPARPKAVADLLALREQATDALLGQLERRGDAEPCWSWWPDDQTVGFTRRMQTYEATMHRVDAELTAGLPVGVIADDVSRGAVDHAVDVMWGWMPDAAAYRPNAVVELVAVDTGGSWLFEVGTWTTSARDAGSPVTGPRAVRATEGSPTATVSAAVGDLALWAWTRGGAVHTDGDRRTLAALDAVLSEGIQ